MFRDTYKAANCDINPDSKLLSQTLSRIEQAEKKPAVIPIRAIGACAASLAIMIGSVYGYMRYTDTMTLDVAPKVIMADTADKAEYSAPQQETNSTAKADSVSATDREDNQPAKKSFSSSDGEASSEPKAKKNAPANTEKSTLKASSTVKSKQSDTASGESKNVSDTDSTQASARIYTPDTDISAEASVPDVSVHTDTGSTPTADTTTSAISDNAEISVASETSDSTSQAIQEDTPANNQPLSGGGGGGSTSRTAKKAASASDEAVMGFAPTADIAYDKSETEIISDSDFSGYTDESAVDRAYPAEITYGEYCEYIGHDLYEELVLPEDIIAERWTTTEFDTENDEVILTYKGTEDRYAEIIPTRNTQKIYDSIKTSSTEEKTSDSAVSYNKDNATAYIVNGDVGYTIRCIGFDKKEFTTLTESIPD